MRWTALFVPLGIVLKGRFKEKRAGLLSSLLTFSFFLALLLLPVEAKPVTFDDGLVHIIDANNSFPLEDVIVQDAPGGIPTEVQLVAGGAIGSVAQQGSLLVSDSSLASIFGGLVRGSLVADDSSTVNMSGGEIDEGLFARIAAALTISGGIVSSIGLSDSTQVNISGGLAGLVGWRRRMW